MTDENRDPTLKSLPNKPRPKPVDARSAAAAVTSSIDSPKSATITNVSQRLPSTSVEVSVGDILSNNDKRASVSVRQQEHRHSTSSTSSSELEENNETISKTKMDLGEATRELTRLLHIGNDHLNKEIPLNPDAPDFTPIDFSPTYRSELAPAHLHRRATQVDYYNNRYSRSRYYSESYQTQTTTPTSATPIRPLLSLIPQYIPNHRQSWTNTSTTSSNSSQSWWQQDSNNSSASSSYHSRPAYPLYSPLMGPLTDDSLYPYRNSSKRSRVHSTRAFVFPSTNNRKRSHSGPETPLPIPETHLNGIHSLVRIMVDILRMIEQPGAPTTYQQNKHRRYQQDQHQQHDDSIEAEDVFVEDTIPTITASIEKATELLNNYGQSNSSEQIITDH